MPCLLVAVLYILFHEVCKDTVSLSENDVIELSIKKTNYFNSKREINFI